MPFLFERMEHMPKQYTPEVKGRAVTYGSAEGLVDTSTA